MKTDTEMDYSRYDRFCLKIGGFMKTVIDGIKEGIWAVFGWCEFHSRFCYAIIIGSIVSWMIAAYFGLYFGFTCTPYIGLIAEGITVLISVVMLFCDRADLLEFEEYCRRNPNPK